MLQNNYEPLKNACEWYKWGEYPIGEEKEKLEKSITVKTKQFPSFTLYLYNYDDKIVLVPRNHFILRKCRGIIINKYGLICNYPFDRFFNDFEKEVDTIDWKTAQIQEKVDGSLISVFWYADSWIATTRKSFYPNDYGGTNFEKKFWQMFSKEKESLLNTKYCYIFELVSAENRIITWYNEEFLVLIGRRNIFDMNNKETSQEELDRLANILGVHRPKRFEANNLSQCKLLFEKLRDDEEGLVIVDEKFNRMKVKQESYFKLVKIINYDEESLFQYILGNIQIDNEYLIKYSKVQETIQNMREKWQLMKLEIISSFNKIKNQPDRKSFALQAITYPYKSLLFILYDNKKIEKQTIVWKNVLKWMKNENI